MNAGLFTYAWDLQDEGYDEAIDTIATAGFTEINLATSYHAGKFLLPHNPRRRVIFPEDGSIYFQPDMTRYGRIKPRVHSLVEKGLDPVASLLRAIRPHGLTYTAWTVCLHNSWLGERYPDITMHTAFGDPLIHSLCPAHPDVREYLLSMIGDLVSHYDVTTIQLESPGYMGFSHGYHHEITGAPWDQVQERLMSMSFNPTEVARASRYGIDVHFVRDGVRTLLDDCWNRGTPLMNGATLSERVVDFYNSSPFREYDEWQNTQVQSLVKAIRDVVKSVNPATHIRYFAALDRSYQDSQIIELSDGLLCGYAESSQDAARRVQIAREYGKTVHGAIRAITPDTQTPDEIGPRIDAWRSAGADSVDVYNYGLMPGTHWDAVVAAISGRTM